MWRNCIITPQLCCWVCCWTDAVNIQKHKYCQSFSATSTPGPVTRWSLLPDDSPHFAVLHTVRRPSVSASCLLFESQLSVAGLLSINRTMSHFTGQNDGESPPGRQPPNTQYFQKNTSGTHMYVWTQAAAPAVRKTASKSSEAVGKASRPVVKQQRNPLCFTAAQCWQWAATQRALTAERMSEHKSGSVRHTVLHRQRRLVLIKGTVNKRGSHISHFLQKMQIHHVWSTLLCFGPRRRRRENGHNNPLLLFTETTGSLSRSAPRVFCLSSTVIFKMPLQLQLHHRYRT